MSDQPPEQPWEIGQHEDYTCFELKVTICEDADGGVWSDHRIPAEQTDLVQTLSGGGARQIAHALLLEAVRREAFCGVLVELSKDGGYLERYLKADEEGKRGVERILANAGLAYLVEMLPRLMPGVSRSVLSMLSEQSPGKPDSF